jgi:hypothetical protein
VSVSLWQMLCGLLLFAATGCAVYEPVMVATPPPPPPARVEAVPAQPGPAYVWVEGHWAWRGPRRGYVWVPGYWAVPHAPGYVWMPGYWAPRPGGYVWIEGHWRLR